MPWTGAQRHGTVPGAIPQLAKGFLAPSLPRLELLKAAPEAQKITAYPPYLLLEVLTKLPYAAEWHCTAPGVILQLAEGFWTSDLPHLDLLKAAPEAQNITACPADSLLEVVPKLPYALDRC